MSFHFFTEDSLLSSRWLQAFPSAQVHSISSENYNEFLAKQKTELPGIYWVLLSKRLSNETLKSIADSMHPLIFMTTSENPAEARQSVELGATGYLHYLSPVPLLMQAAQVVEQGGLWLGADLMRQIVFATANQLSASSNHPDLSVLTDREKVVADLVAAGKTNKEIARDLGITERTVKAHMSAIFEKLQVRDRLQLVLKMSGK